jgi:predicted SAM-dependent methyltransferase
MNDLCERSHIRLPPEADDGLRRLHVGCGPYHSRMDWWNVDLRPFRGVDEVMDAVQPWRWHDILDFVYAEHFLEHLSIGDGLKFLENAGRALKPGGRIRLTTPALEWVVKTHFTFDASENAQQLNTLHLNRAFYGWGHRFLYSKPMLARVLEAVGYGQVQFCEYGRSGVSDLQDLELHGEFKVDFGFPSVWIVEATKTCADMRISDEFIGFVDGEYGQFVEAGH